MRSRMERMHQTQQRVKNTEDWGMGEQRLATKPRVGPEFCLLGRNKQLVPKQ